MYSRPVLYSRPGQSVLKQFFSTLQVHSFLRALWCGKRSGEARAVAISAALAAASADNEKPLCLAAIKLLLFHERNPEFFLRPKQKSQPFIRFIII